MKYRAKVLHKYPEVSGIGSTGNSWRSQEIKFQLLHEDGSDTNENIVASCNNSIFIDSPAIAPGAIGILSVWHSVSEYNGRSYNRVYMQGWTPLNAPVDDKEQKDLFT